MQTSVAGDEELSFFRSAQFSASDVEDSAVIYDVSVGKVFQVIGFIKVRPREAEFITFIIGFECITFCVSCRQCRQKRHIAVHIA